MPAQTRSLENAPSRTPAPAESLGLAVLARASSDPARVEPLWEALMARATADEPDMGALLDLSTLLLATGDRQRGLDLQAAAIAAQRCFRRAAPGPQPLRLLALSTAGDFTANTPLDFLLEGSNVELISYYVDESGSLSQVPEHDVAFLAVGESEAAAPILRRLETALQDWPRPLLNNQPALIAGLTRDGVAERFAGHPKVLCPLARRSGRDELGAVAAGAIALDRLADGLAFPIVARPAGTHAGIGMEKLCDAADLQAFLANRPEAEFYVTAFHDYAGSDGLFRKLRIVFIKGRPFLSHLAVSERWMVHYLNADMEASEANRAEEAQMMADFDDDFAVRHAEALRAVHAQLPFDYFGIDCAETADGRLLVFEADVALIVHAMDPEDLFPYKKPAMAKLFAAFVAMLHEEGAARRASPPAFPARAS